MNMPSREVFDILLLAFTAVGIVALVALIWLEKWDA